MHLAQKDLLLKEGTIVDVTLIAAPPSTDNKDGKRALEIRQSQEGKKLVFRDEGTWRSTQRAMSPMLHKLMHYCMGKKNGDKCEKF